MQEDMTFRVLTLTRLHCFILLCLFFSAPSTPEHLVTIYSWTKRFFNQQRWNRCFRTLLPHCSITLQQMRCQKKWIEMCFIAPRSPSANGFNYLTNIVSLEEWKKLFVQSPPGRARSKPRQAHTQPITQQYFLKLALISCCFQPPPLPYGQAQTWKNWVLRLYNGFTSFLFFPVTVFLGGWHWLPQTHIVINSPIVSQTSELGDLWEAHFSIVAQQVSAWTQQLCIHVGPGLTPPPHTHTQQLCFKSSQCLFSWFPENIRVYIFLKDFRFFLPTFIITVWRQIVVKIKATRYNFFLQDKEKHNLKIAALSVFQSGRRSQEHSWTLGILVNKAGIGIQ